MQKRVAAAVRQLDKAKPAVAPKPLHHRLYRRPRRLLLKPRRRTEARRARRHSRHPTAAVIPAAATAAAKIIVKIAPPAAIAMPSPVFHDRLPIPSPGPSHPATTIMQLFPPLVIGNGVTRRVTVAAVGSALDSGRREMKGSARDCSTRRREDQP